MVSEKEGLQLIRLARESILSYLENREPVIGKSVRERFSEKQGVFVTLHRNSELRGCIGFIEPIYPLYEAVVEAARASAFSDPRFPPVRRNELADIVIELSVLTKPGLISVKKAEEYLSLVKVGRDGLIIRSRFSSGVLLPQVPVEYSWSTEEFLGYVCMKAGLHRDAWKDMNNRLYAFQAEIFREK